MAEQDESPFAAYVRQITAQLTELTSMQRETIEAELWSHLEDFAAQQRRDPSDPVMQATMIRELGSSRRLGRKLARAYRQNERTYIVLGWRGWLLWCLASTLVWGLTSPSLGYEDGTMWRFSTNGVLMGMLHVLIVQRHLARPAWWRSGLLAFCGPWLILTVVYWLLPWESFTESRAERTLFGSFAAIGLINGITQWIVLRPYLVAAAGWLVIPFATLLLSFIGMITVNIELIPLGISGQLDAIGGWPGMFVILSFVFGLLYGVISGTALLALCRRRPPTAQLA